MAPVPSTGGYPLNRSVQFVANISENNKVIKMDLFGQYIMSTRFQISGLYVISIQLGLVT